MHKSYYVLLLLLTIYTSLFAHTEEKVQTDSIMNIIHKTSSTQKLELLKDHIDAYPNNTTFIQELEKEANIQNDYLSLAIVNINKTYHFVKAGNTDSTHYYLNKIEENLSLLNEKKGGPTSLSTKDFERYKKIRRILISTKVTAYINEGKYNLALIEMRRAQEDEMLIQDKLFESQGYLLLGYIYLYMDKEEEALKNFSISSTLESQHRKTNPNPGGYNFYSPMEGSIIALGMLENYPKAILLIDTLANKIEEEYATIKSIRKVNAEDKFKYSFFKNRLLCYSIMGDIKTGNIHGAETKLKEVKPFVEDTLNSNGFHPDFDIYYLIEAEYYLETKDYKKAKEKILTLTNRLSIDKQFQSYMLSNLTLSKILSAENRNKEAYDLIYGLRLKYDSINTARFSTEAFEIQSLYEVSKAKMVAENASLRLKKAHFFIFTIVIVLLLFIILGINILRNKKVLREKNKQLFKQYEEVKQRNIEILKLQSKDEKYTNSESVGENPKNNILYKLDKYLVESQAFLNPKLTREEVALKIGTNRQYLIEAIKEQTGKTFNEFIYCYRIKTAYELIVNNKNKSIAQVLSESGFHTKSTFYNEFKKAYGMTPMELRDIL